MQVMDFTQLSFIAFSVYWCLLPMRVSTGVQTCVDDVNFFFIFFTKKNPERVIKEREGKKWLRK